MAIECELVEAVTELPSVRDLAAIPPLDCVISWRKPHSQPLVQDRLFDGFLQLVAPAHMNFLSGFELHRNTGQ